MHLPTLSTSLVAEIMIIVRHRRNVIAVAQGLGTRAGISPHRRRPPARTRDLRSWPALLPHRFQRDLDGLVFPLDPCEEIGRSVQASRPGSSLEFATQLRKAHGAEGGPVGLQRVRRSSDFVRLTLLQPLPGAVDQPGYVVQERVDKRCKKTPVVSNGLLEAL